MRRRDFITLVGGAVIAWPRAVVAQSTDRVRRIGVLIGFAESDPEGQREVAALKRGLEDVGWALGRNLQIDYRYWAGDASRAPALAKELVELLPEVLVAAWTPSVIALRQAARGIPIVFVSVFDPVGQGFVPNLARPGGGITGFSTGTEGELGGKWLEMLKEVAPSVRRVAVIFKPEDAPYAHLYLQSIEAAGRSLAVEAIASPVHNADEIENVIAAAGREEGGSLIVLPDPFLNVREERIIASTARHHVPAISSMRSFAMSGGLLAYGTDRADLFRRAASYVDRILKGAKPGELPVQEPTKFELLINLKAAKALGLAIPPSFLALADEVIE